MAVSYLWEARDGLLWADEEDGAEEDGADVISRGLSDRARYTACSSITSVQFIPIKLSKLIANWRIERVCEKGGIIEY